MSPEEGPAAVSRRARAGAPAASQLTAHAALVPVVSARTSRTSRTSRTARRRLTCGKHHYVYESLSAH